MTLGRETSASPWRTLMAGLLLSCIPLTATGAEALSKTAAATAPLTNTAAPKDPASDLGAAYFVTTPQLGNPMRPLDHLPGEAQVALHAAVVTVPDPVETHLGRSFDIVLAALLNSFQAKGFALDGFAFTWPRAPKAEAGGSNSGTREYRRYPSVLLFRKDAWRQAGMQSANDEYYLLFLVGESPIFGVHPQAFKSAARCAMRFNGALGSVAGVSQGIEKNKGCDDQSLGLRIADVNLDVIGPTFSGSMQSLAIALAGLCGQQPCVDPAGHTPHVTLLSPSATASSNTRIGRHPVLGSPPMMADTADAVGRAKVDIEYVPLGIDLTYQLVGLLTYLCESSPPKDIVILTEESTFGRAVLDIVNRDLADEVDRRENLKRCLSGADSGPEEDRNTGDRLRELIATAQFSPNINAIRAEHSSRDRSSEAQISKAVPVKKRLLEFNMDEVEAGIDRPPVYQPSLSSRSDELMLYRTFDSLRTRKKPDVVAIVATDVRDRLFLLSEVRKTLPAALPVVFEMDYLMVHPDYRATSRGALIVPTGGQTVCLGVRNDELVRCQASDKERAERAKSGNRNIHGRRVSNKRRFTFATDFAANAFRAASLLIQYRTGGSASKSISGLARESEEKSAREMPSLYVATLGGFSRLETSGKKSRKCAAAELGIGQHDGCAAPGVGSLAAADTRMAVQMPVYLLFALISGFFVCVSVWIWEERREARTMLPFARHLLFDAGWLGSFIRAPWAWWKERGKRAPPQEAVEWLTPTHKPVWLLALLALGLLSLALALLRLWSLSGERDFLLAHGRDPSALVCLFLIYMCVALVGFMRLSVVDRRNQECLEAIDGSSAVAGNQGWSGPKLTWLVPILMAGAALWAYTRNQTPRSVDDPALWLLMLVVLGVGVAFLFHLGRQMRMFSRLTLRLSCCIPHVRGMRKNQAWPGPSATNEPAQTPFNLSPSRKRDLPELQVETPGQWAIRSKQLIAGAAMAPAEFDGWQARLIGEMKLAAMGIRTSAWCAMLAPIAVLIALSVYPPVQQRLLTSVSILMLVASFSTTVYIVLRLEKDAMLGLMFTRDGDQLTFGGSLRALWPKLLAMGVILVPLVVPDIWNLVHSMIRSINSFG